MSPARCGGFSPHSFLFLPRKVQVSALVTSLARTGSQPLRWRHFPEPFGDSVPLLAGGGHFAESELWQRGIVAGTDPAHPGYWGRLANCDQRQVEQPAIALALVMKPEIFWNPLTPGSAGAWRIGYI